MKPFKVLYFQQRSISEREVASNTLLQDPGRVEEAQRKPDKPQVKEANRGGELLQQAEPLKQEHYKNGPPMFSR